MESLSLVAHIPAPPEAVFDAWISAAGHSAMSGGGATGGSSVGEAFTAWDGYIQGAWRALERPGRVLMDWRTAEFPADAPFSQVELLLAPAAGGTELRLNHTNIPDGQAARYRDGWDHFYFAPMKAHFGG